MRRWDRPVSAWPRYASKGAHTPLMLAIEELEQRMGTERFNLWMKRLCYVAGLSSK